MIDKFKDKFVEESLDNIHDLEEALFLLENDMENKEIIERIFRAMHSLKGGGAMFGFNDLSEFTHHLETIFDLVRNDKLSINNNIISLTFESIDHIKHLLDIGDITEDEDRDNQIQFIKKVQAAANSGENSEDGKIQAESQAVVAEEETDNSQVYLIDFLPNEDILRNGTNPLYLLDDLHSMGEARIISYTEKVPELNLFDPINSYCHWQIVLYTSDSVNDIKDVFIFVEDECTINVHSVGKGNILQLDAVNKLLTDAQNSQTPLSPNQLNDFVFKTADEKKKDHKVDELKTTLEKKAKPTSKKKAQLKEHKISSIRVASNKIDELVNLVSEMVTIQAQLNLYAENDGKPGIMQLAENIQKLSRQLRDNAFAISLIPLQSELMRFQRLVRDLSKELNKDVDFIVEGGDIELDKNIIEHLTDPLLHIIRNSMDHGIETPEEREKAGKPAQGIILFKAYYSGASVIIEVKDDGKGIDADFVRNKAIKKELIDVNAELTRKETFDLVFLSGFSTKEVVSDVSGRGVGMDVVKKKIGEIRGEVSLDSEMGKGTTITLELPMTLSIIDGLLVRVADNQYVIPIASIEKIHAVDSSIVFAENFNNVVKIGDEQFPYIDLRETFNEAELETKTGEEQLILVKYEDRQIALLVDFVIGEYQTVVKALGRFLKGQDNISGASIMGDGSISLVIDTNRLIHNDLMKKYHKE